MNSKNVRFVKMLCAEDIETLEKWVTLIRIAKHGKKILENHRLLLDDLAREEIDKLSSARSGSIGSIVSSVPSQLSTGSGGSSKNSHQNGRLSRASSSSSSGCLSDDNNGFDSEFPTGTIKRKPSMKPNLPLTSMTRQLKEVGETTLALEENNTTSPERGGTLTRRHSRRRSEESNGSGGTLKRRQSSRGSIESVNSTPSSSTPTPSNPGTPSGMNRSIYNLTNNNSSSNSTLNNSTNNLKTLSSPLETMPSCMTDSVFSLPPPPDDMGASLSASMMSLDSLPPPPPPSELINDFSGSQVSLASLPPPPPIEATTPVFVPLLVKQSEITVEVKKEIIKPPPLVLSPTTHAPPPMIYSSKTMAPTGVLKSPPYKNPPPPSYNSGSNTLPPPPPSTKSVTFADSPVLLRRKVCFEDEVQQFPSVRNTNNTNRESLAPIPPPRAEATRLSTSPKRLADSVSNPPRDFLKDLQRVMRKKWQVAQKCKLEPATTPHEVLGFRDFNELSQNGGTTSYYSESANVSNWVQEHYGANSLYENLGKNSAADRVNSITSSPSSAIKKRPPPPPPKRSESTQLSTRNQI
jgi:amyloid beta A4 precursor protein-binding family B protein 1-interacting protein